MTLNIHLKPVLPKPQTSSRVETSFCFLSTTKINLLLNVHAEFISKSLKTLIYNCYNASPDTNLNNMFDKSKILLQIFEDSQLQIQCFISQLHRSYFAYIYGISHCHQIKYIILISNNQHFFLSIFCYLIRFYYLINL